MIPKVIHYCWFGGGKLPDAAIRCIESWKKHCPDYRIVKWDETNFDIGCNRYAKDAYAAKKWSLVTDVARLKILYEHGGIYLDTDVEIIRPLDSLLKNRAFMGIESTGWINTGSGYGAEKGLPILKELLDEFNTAAFSPENPAIFSIMDSVMRRKGYVFNNQIQQIDHVTIYPMDYFAPINLTTRKLKITKNTYSIHHYTGSWQSEEYKKSTQFRAFCCKVFGENIGLRIYGHCFAIKAEGFVRYIKKRIKR